MKHHKNFDIYSMCNPMDEQSILLALQEIRSELRNINSHIDAVARSCEENAQEA